MSNHVLQLENSSQIGVGSKGISFNEFSIEFLLKDAAESAHSCGDVKCGASMPF